MSSFEQLAKTIGLFYSAASGEVEWARPLRQLTNLCGGVAATLELVDLQQDRPVFFQSFGLNPASAGDYIDHYQLISPRMRHGLKANNPNICYDYQFISEEYMDANAFYADFLAPDDLRYYVGGTLERTANRLALFSVQRSVRQGHVEKQEIEIVNQILPHIRRALNLSVRLDEILDYGNQLENVVDRHSHGVVLISWDGCVMQANSVAQEIFSCNNGLGIRERKIEFTDRSAAKHFDAILQELADKNNHAPWPETEFLVARKSGKLPYAMSVYPAHQIENTHNRRYLAIVFIRDLDQQRRLSYRRVKTVLGLTRKEAQLAIWIAGGGTLEAFARHNDITMNTVYTHCRHLKEKAGCRSQTILAIKINQIAG